MVCNQKCCKKNIAFYPKKNSNLAPQYRANFNKQGLNDWEICFVDPANIKICRSWCRAVLGYTDLESTELAMTQLAKSGFKICKIQVSTPNPQYSLIALNTSSGNNALTYYDEGSLLWNAWFNLQSPTNNVNDAPQCSALYNNGLSYGFFYGNQESGDVLAITSGLNNERANNFANFPTVAANTGFDAFNTNVFISYNPNQNTTTLTSSISTQGLLDTYDIYLVYLNDTYIQGKITGTYFGIPSPCPLANFTSLVAAIIPKTKSNNEPVAITANSGFSSANQRSLANNSGAA